MYYRQAATAAVGGEVKIWLQPIFAFARKASLIDAKRQAEITVKLAWRRHGHLSLDAETLLSVLQEDTSAELVDYRATSAFIGTRNADLMSHLSVSLAFLLRIWQNGGVAELKTMRATGILLEQLTRFRNNDWALVLALAEDGASWDLREYIHRWVIGHFLGLEKLRQAERELSAIRRPIGRKHGRAVGRSGPPGSQEKLMSLSVALRYRRRKPIRRSPKPSRPRRPSSCTCLSVWQPSTEGTLDQHLFASSTSTSP